ncbi:MAG: hypothetical protein QM802_22595 [Agriterribacter sp.]
MLAYVDYSGVIIPNVIVILILLITFLANNNQLNQPTSQAAINYQKRLNKVWLIVGTSVSIFASLTSLYFGLGDEKRSQETRDLAGVSAHLDTISNILDSQAISLIRLDTSLGNKNVQLGDINQKLGKENNSLIQKVENIAAKTHVLTNEINQLSQNSNQLLAILKKNTDDEFAIAGELSLKLDSNAIGKAAIPRIDWGNNNIMLGYYMPYQRLNFFNDLPAKSTWDAISIRAEQYRILLKGKIVDLEENIIMEIQENKWRVNKAFLGKFNFDDKGMEIFDTKGRVIFSINLSSDNTITFRGLITTAQNPDLVIVSSDNGFHLFESREKKVRDSLLTTIYTKPLFKYLGNKWHGVRN